MGDGAKLFAEIGRQKLLDQDATASLRVTEEFLSAAAQCGDPRRPLRQPRASPRRCRPLRFPESSPRRLPATRLGFETPSLFLARRVETDGNGLRVLAPTPMQASAADLHRRGQLALSRSCRPGWATKRFEFTILDLPEPDDAPAETAACSRPRSPPTTRPSSSRSSCTRWRMALLPRRAPGSTKASPNFSARFGSRQSAAAPPRSKI